MIYLAFGLFAWAIFSTAWGHVERAKRGVYANAHVQEIDGINRIGKWYEDRVAELESENRQLAEQLISAGAVRHLAMPLPTDEPYKEYAYDDTGLVREELDPRDLPVS